MKQWKMSVRGMGVLVGVLLALPSLALAGGWSVVTLDSAPANVQPGVPFTVGFVVRQHGVHLLGGLMPKITATNATTGVTVSVIARADGAEGHYVATFSVPAAGRWNWQIAAFGPEAIMSPLEVQAPVPQPARAVGPVVAATSHIDVQPWLIGMLLVAGAALCSLLVMRHRRWSIRA